MPLPRATEVVPAGQWDPATAADRVVVDHDGRHRRRLHYHGVSGAGFVLDLPRAVVLADGDGLLLDDGRIVAVEAASEPLIEITAADARALLRIVWHIGNRHLAAELRGDAVRLRADHVIADMLRGLGGTVVALDAPFNPEAGAYAAAGHGHGHGHGHDH